jgi:uncharacterized membrane protein
MCPKPPLRATDSDTGLVRTPTAGLEKAVIAVGAGLAVALAVGFAASIPLSYDVTLGWDVAAATYAAVVWLTSWPLDADGTARNAVREDPTRPVADVLLLAAAVASIAAVAFAIADASTTSGSAKALRAAVGVGTIVCSWFLVHTVFTLKYARAYFGSGEGGIDFKTDKRPRWTDFAYLSFTVGMTFQVSDTDLQTGEFRRLALRHSLLSYLFGAVIIAVAINLVAGLTK